MNGELTAAAASMSTAAPNGTEDDSFSLVLGAGGRPGLAYHAGTLLALDLHGICPSNAVSMTGTSAGSIATALFVAGGTVEDLAAYTVGASPRDQFRSMDELIRAAEARRGGFDPGAVRRLIDPRRAAATLSHLARRQYAAALVTSLPGVLEIASRFDFFDTVESGALRWRIAAADLRGRRHVLTARNAPLSGAVAASCAIPGLFAPVRVGSHRLVDGGIHSTTNADLAAADRCAIVIVVAPMCTPGDPPSQAAATLAGEIHTLERIGKRVVTFRPSLELRRLMGRNPLSAKRSRAITAQSFLEASDVLSTLTPRRRRSSATIAPAAAGPG